MKHHHVVCAIIRHQGHILCVQRNTTQYPYTSLHWEFPGGKIEEGETPQQALKRELMEEMDYPIAVGPLLTTVNYSYPDFEITLEAFLCNADNRNFRLKEHVDSRWLLPSELETLDWCAADWAIIHNPFLCTPLLEQVMVLLREYCQQTSDYGGAVLAIHRNRFDVMLAHPSMIDSQWLAVYPDRLLSYDLDQGCFIPDEQKVLELKDIVRP